MTEECITPLRRRMIEDMSVRHFASKTQHDYIRTVMKLTRFLGRSPDTATNEDLRRFQLHLTENRAGAPIINSTVSALRFFFTVTLGRADGPIGVKNVRRQQRFCLLRNDALHGAPAPPASSPRRPSDWRRPRSQDTRRPRPVRTAALF